MKSEKPRAPGQGFQKGNQLAVKGRYFSQELHKALVQDDRGRLRKCAEKLLTLASQGEQWAVRELADRLDGKPTQQVEMNVNDQRADELSDTDLLLIAARGSSRASQEKVGEEVSSIVH